VAEAQGARAKPRMAECTAGRKMSCGGDGCEWQGKGTHLCPSPVIYISRGSNTPKNFAQRPLMRAAPYVADQRAQPRQNSHAHARAIITALLPKRHCATSRPPPTSPTMPTQRRLKMRAHYTRPWPSSLQSKDNPRTTGAKGSRTDPLRVRPNLKQAEPSLTLGTQGPAPRTLRLLISGLKSLPSRAGAADAPRT
jgi:hypothetical protein